MLKSFTGSLFKSTKKNINTEEGINGYYKSLFYDSPVAMYTCDRSGNIIAYNKSAVELWGREPDPNIDFWCAAWKVYNLNGDLISKKNTPLAKLPETASLNEATEIIIERPDNSFRNVRVYSRTISDEQNNINGIHFTVVNTGNKSNAIEKQAILSAIVESSEDAIISKNINGFITSWNNGAQKIFGYTEAEALGQHITFLIPKERLEEEDKILASIKSGVTVNHFQTVRVHKSGKKVPVSLTVSPLKNHDNKIIGASKIARDISDILFTQETLKQNAEHLETLNSIGKVISEKLDVDVILQQVTDATTKITGAAFGAFFYNTKDDDGEAMMLFNLSGAPREIFEKLGMPRHTTLFQPTFSGKGIIRVDDITKDPRYGKNKPYHGMPNGHLPVVSYLAVPVISSSGEVIGGLLFGHPDAGVFKEEHEDIISSICSQAAVALENSKLFEEVKALSAKKDEFIALASHELKTPLTSIKGYLQLLDKKIANKEDSFFIQKALYQVEKLNLLIADLLNVSKIEAGKLQLNLDVFDLTSTIKDVRETFLYANKSHQININDIDLELFIEADKLRIEQVIINLLSNAVKYSPKATNVNLFLTYNDKEVTLKIKDQGIGLTEKQTKNLFTKFYRAEAILNVSGLGLGLYLSNEIINRHKGKMEVKSEFGVGSEFSFTLPLKIQ